MPTKPKRVPLGQPLPLSDNDLDALANITDQDLLAAHQFITAVLSPKFKNLLLTKPVIENDARPNRRPDA